MKKIKNPIRLIASIVIALFAFIFIFAAIKGTSTSITRTNSFNIPTPQKIILYDNDKAKTLEPKDKNFNKVLTLISERLGNMKSFKMDTVSESIDMYTYDEKKSCRCLQLVYDNETMMKLSSDNKELELKFKKLHFLVAAEGDHDYGTNLVYGDDTTTHVINENYVHEDVMCKLLRIVHKEIR